MFSLIFLTVVLLIALSFFVFRTNKRIRKEVKKRTFLPKVGGSGFKDAVRQFTSCFSKKPYAFKCFKFIEVSTNALAVQPQPRSGHRMGCDESNILCFGGYDSWSTLFQEFLMQPLLEHHFKEVWCYNISLDRWTEIKTTGTAPNGISHSMVLRGNYLIAFGGTGIPFGQESSNILSICDLRTREWRTIECDQTQGPPPSYGNAMFVDDTTGALYVVGGTLGFIYNMDVHRLNLRSLKWERLYETGDDLNGPSPRYRHELAFDGQRLYVIGGGTTFTVCSLVNIPAFDVLTRTWTTVTAKMPATLESLLGHVRKCHGAAQLGDDLYIVGGLGLREHVSGVWKLNIKAMEWTFLPILQPIPAYFHSVSITPLGCLYMFGGVHNLKTLQRTNRIFKAWVKVPKMQEMCWEALCLYKNRFEGKSEQDLVNMGIPRTFISRLSPPGIDLQASGNNPVQSL